MQHLGRFSQLSTVWVRGREVRQWGSDVAGMHGSASDHFMADCTETKQWLSKVTDGHRLLCGWQGERDDGFEHLYGERKDRIYLPSSLESLLPWVKVYPLWKWTPSYSGMHNLAISIENQNLKSLPLIGCLIKVWMWNEAEMAVIKQVGLAVHCQRSRVGILRARVWLASDGGPKRPQQTPFSKGCSTGSAWRRLAAPMESKEVPKTLVW